MRIVLSIAGMLVAASAWGARPFVTDDARLTTDGSCQVEAWVRSYPKSTETWALPACNPTGNLEVTLGAGRARYENAPATSDQIVQFKTLFRETQTNGWGWGLAVGAVRHPEINPGPNQLGNTYAYLPFTFSFLDDRAFVHANAGWLRDKATQRHNASWGIGGEYSVHARASLIAETFGDNRSKPYWQTGARFFIVPNLFQIDATVGRQFDTPNTGQWLSIGVRYTPDKLF